MNEDDVELYIVELVYPDYNDNFVITQEKCKNHLQLRASTPLWHKENMINVAVEKLLPKDWKAFAWLDTDIEFESETWVSDTLKLLSKYDIVQLFSHSVDLDYMNNTQVIRSSFGYQHIRNQPFHNTEWHPGFAWAINRDGYNRIEKLFDSSIIGGGDNLIAMSLINRLHNTLKYFEISDDFSSRLLDFFNKARTLSFGYTPGVIRHYFHGNKKNRKYAERINILIQHKYNTSWLSYDKNGVLVPNESFPDELKADIYNYFKERNEDEYY